MYNVLPYATVKKKKTLDINSFLPQNGSFEIGLAYVREHFYKGDKPPIRYLTLQLALNIAKDLRERN